MGSAPPSGAVDVVGLDARTGRDIASAVSSVAGVLACCALMSLAAHVRVPVPGSDVPMTLQSLAMLLAGYALAPSSAAMSMGTYLICGAVGLPVFAPGSAGVFGPTGGYIVGFVGAAWAVSFLRGDRQAGCVRLLAAGAMGMTVLLGCGVAWRAALAHSVGAAPQAAVLTGLIPFLSKSIVEILLAAATVSCVRGWRRVHGACRST